MSEVDDQLELIEMTIKEAKKKVAFRDAVRRLTKNKDYIKVFDDGYFKEEAARLVLLKGDPNLVEDSDIRRLDGSIDAIGYTHLYLRTIMQLGAMAEQSIEENELGRNEILEEEANG